MGVGGCEIQIAGQIGMKFGTEVVIEGRKVLGGVDPVPPPHEFRVHIVGTGCSWSLSHTFWSKLIKTKYAGYPPI